jgi:hypothetical protein
MTPDTCLPAAAAVLGAGDVLAVPEFAAGLVDAVVAAVVAGVVLFAGGALVVGVVGAPVEGVVLPVGEPLDVLL